jgi:transcriptional regulator with XRE-family HTH domain
VVLNDEIGRGSTILELLARLSEYHVASVRIACTHSLFTDGAVVPESSIRPSARRPDAFVRATKGQVRSRPTPRTSSPACSAAQFVAASINAVPVRMEKPQMKTSWERRESSPSRFGATDSRNQEERELAVPPEREFAVRVRRRRLQQRWTIDELAERSGVSRAAISKIERGECSTRLGNVVRIAQAFGVQPGQLLDSAVQPIRVRYQGLAARPESPATTVSTTVMTEIDTGLELVRYELPSYGRPAALVRREPGARQIVLLLAGEVLVGSGADQVELTGGDIATVSAAQEHPLHNIGGGQAELLLIVSRTHIR